MKDFSKATVSKYQTQFFDIEIERLHPAEWNYKLDPPDDVRDKFRNSIVVDGSIGALAVRESPDLPDGHYEVIDGNHRLEIVQELGWEKVHIENFGKLSVGQAGHISYRRNHEWFPKDDMQWAELLDTEILPEFNDNVADLAQILPDTEQQIQETRKMFEFDWSQYQGPGSNDNTSDEGDDTDEETPLDVITYELPLEHAAIIRQALSCLAQEIGVTESVALAYLAYYSTTIDTAFIKKAFHAEMLKRIDDTVEMEI